MKRILVLACVLLLIPVTTLAHEASGHGPYDPSSLPPGVEAQPEIIEHNDVFQEDNLADQRARNWNGWVQRNGFWYSYNNGIRRTGWFRSGGAWYFLHPSTGRMQTGWITVSGHSYFLNPRTGHGRDPNRPEGAMLNGWVDLGTYWYFLNPATGNNHNPAIPYGAMFRNVTRVINNVRRQFDHGGRWLIWHSDSHEVSFWQGAIGVHSITVGTVSAGFQFHTQVTNARLDWGQAIGVPINLSLAPSLAQIRAFGGTRASMEFADGREPGWSTGIGGWAITPRTHHATIIGNGTVRQVNRTNGQASFFVIELSTAATWTAANREMSQMTTSHELGHNLGFHGHSNHATDVMFPSVHRHYRVNPTEGQHLRQIYRMFR